MSAKGARNKAKFITIEGVEGVGKSTNIEFIKDYLAHRNVDFLVTREPGGTDIAEKIRELLLADHAENMDSTAELLLMFAARAQHLNKLIKPALQRGCWVLCDRFTDATYAYQGGGRELGMETISKLEQLVQGDLRPDLTLILDLEPQLGLTRAASRGELDRFEKEKIEFFDRVRQTYLQRADANPVRYAVVDASLPLEQVKSATLAVVARLFNEANS